MHSDWWMVFLCSHALIPASAQQISIRLCNYELTFHVEFDSFWVLSVQNYPCFIRSSNWFAAILVKNSSSDQKWLPNTKTIKYLQVTFEYLSVTCTCRAVSRMILWYPMLHEACNIFIYVNNLMGQSAINDHHHHAVSKITATYLETHIVATLLGRWMLVLN